MLRLKGFRRGPVGQEPATVASSPNEVDGNMRATWNHVYSGDVPSHDVTTAVFMSKSSDHLYTQQYDEQGCNIDH